MKNSIHTEIKTKAKMEISINKTLLTNKNYIEDFTFKELNLLLKINDKRIRKGDPNEFEPDFLLGEDIGIEITNAAAVKNENNTSIIKEIIDGNYKPENFSTDIKNAIEVCIEKKIKKIYSISNVSLAIQILFPDFNVKFVPDDNQIEPINQKQTEWVSPDFLVKIYNLAINSKKFHELYLILPFFDNKIVIYSIGKTVRALIDKKKSGEVGTILVSPDVFDFPVSQLVSARIEY